MSILHELFATIEARKTDSEVNSWTAKLLSKGPEKCAEKFEVANRWSERHLDEQWNFETKKVYWFIG